MLPMFQSALRGPGSALVLLVALALVAGPALAQRPPQEGTGGAAGVLPPPMDMRSVPQPMNAPAVAPADSIEESSDAAAPETKEDGPAPDDDSSAEQPR
jgi:hypothetical protein